MVRARSARLTLRAFVLAGVGFFVVWNIGIILNWPHQTTIRLALYGFVFHVIFGKAYALIPAYFERDLVSAWIPRIHFPCSIVGTSALATAPLFERSGSIELLGSLLWGVAATLFFFGLIWTIKDNLLAVETGSAGPNRNRRHIDRVANLFMPIALGYFLLGSYETIALTSETLPGSTTSSPQVIHLLAGGTGALLIFSIGARLLPRFFVASAPRWIIWVLLPTGALGPLVISAGFVDVEFLKLGALIQGIAMVSYAALIASLSFNTDRQRPGFVGIVFGAIFGVVAVFAGAMIAYDISGAGILIHPRLMLAGFLGLTIFGVLFQFYPPGVVEVPGGSNRIAVAALCCIAVGLGVISIDPLISPNIGRIGDWTVLSGGVLILILLGLVFFKRGRR